MDTLTNSQGVAPDTRGSSEKLSDYLHDEVLGGSDSPLWVEKLGHTTLSQRKQSNSWSCGGQSGAKAFESFTGIISSANPIYRNRTNFPSKGMYLQDIGNISKNVGTCSEQESPSQDMTEEQMSLVVLPNINYAKISAYYFLPVKERLNMDLLAQALEQGHALILGISSNADEYTSIPLAGNNPTTFSHFVCCVPDNYTLYAGEKALVIDDSANAYSTLNKGGQRVFTESFIKSRSWGIMGLIRANESVMPKPKVQLNKDLSFGMTDDDVLKLQTVLQYEGCFPKDIIPTRYFGQITKASMIKFQNKHPEEILTPAEIKVGTGFCGTLSRSYINKNYE